MMVISTKAKMHVSVMITNEQLTNINIRFVLAHHTDITETVKKEKQKMAVTTVR